MKTLKKPKPQSAKSLKPLKNSASEPAPTSSLQESTTGSVSNDSTAEFEQALAQGEAKLAEAEAPKRGRGRPKKAVSANFEIVSDTASDIGGNQIPQPAAAQYPPGTTSALWKIGSKFASRRSGFAGFECDASEIEALDGATVPVLNKYLPPALVEASPLATLAITAVAVFGMKYLEYSDWRATQVNKAIEPGNPAPIQ